VSVVSSIHDSLTVETSGFCRNCKQEKKDHVAEKCLFESTSFVEMSPEEVMRHISQLFMKMPDSQRNAFKQEYLGVWPPNNETEDEREARLTRASWTRQSWYK
jgi:hypothetical protein